MGKHTKKWEKDFEKRYSNAIKELQALEDEYKEMKESNPDKYISVWPDDTYIGFGELDGFYVTHYPENHDPDAPQEHIGLTVKSNLASFSFQINTFNQLKEFRNEVIDAMDSFNRPTETKQLVDDDCEDEVISFVLNNDETDKKPDPLGEKNKKVAPKKKAAKKK